jgi:hypothetical protein
VFFATLVRRCYEMFSNKIKRVLTVLALSSGKKLSMTWPTGLRRGCRGCREAV